MTPLQKLLEYARAHYGDDLSYEAKDILNKANELLIEEESYIKTQVESAYDTGYGIGIRYAVQKSLDSTQY